MIKGLGILKPLFFNDFIEKMSVFYLFYELKNNKNNAICKREAQLHAPIMRQELVVAVLYY